MLLLWPKLLPCLLCWYFWNGTQSFCYVAHKKLRWVAVYMYIYINVYSSQSVCFRLYSLTEALLMMTFSFWSLGLAATHTKLVKGGKKEIPEKRLVSLGGFSFSSIFFFIWTWVNVVSLDSGNGKWPENETRFRLRSCIFFYFASRFLSWKHFSLCYWVCQNWSSFPATTFEVIIWIQPKASSKI